MVYFKKSQPAPLCLINEKGKKAGDYKCGNVLERIKNDFHNKCYICEYKEPVTINVEHFKPHEGDKDLKFDWNNLFWSCGHCNNIKLEKYTDLIDCTNKNENIENRIKISIRPFPKEKVVLEGLDKEVSTFSTIKLLDSVYNGTTKLKTIESANLRNKLLTEIKDFQNYLFDYYNDEFDEEHKEFFLVHIKRHLGNKSNFTAFKRWIIRENEVLMKDFEQYFIDY